MYIHKTSYKQEKLMFLFNLKESAASPAPNFEFM